MTHARISSARRADRDPEVAGQRREVPVAVVVVVDLRVESQVSVQLGEREAPGAFDVSVDGLGGRRGEALGTLRARPEDAQRDAAERGEERYHDPASGI